MKADLPPDLTVLCLDPTVAPHALPPRRAAVRVERHALTGTTQALAAPGEAAGEEAALQAVFQRTGGLVREDEAARLLAARGTGADLGTLVAEGRVVALPRGGVRLVPLFQFAGSGPQPCAGVQAALAELADVFDDGESAAWFARPNPWLGGLAPAEAVAGAPGAVLQAARAERFIRRW
jgi:hypothetical protein